MKDTSYDLRPLVAGLDTLIADCSYRIGSSAQSDVPAWDNIQNPLLQARECLESGDIARAKSAVSKARKFIRRAHLDEDVSERLEDSLSTLQEEVFPSHYDFLNNADWWFGCERNSVYKKLASQPMTDKRELEIVASPMMFWHILFVVFGIGLLVKALWFLPSSLYVFAVLFFLAGTFLGTISTVLAGPFAGSGLVFIFFVPSYFFRWFTDKIPNVGQTNPLDIIIPYWGGLVFGWLFVGWAIFNWRVQRECLRYGAFSTLWARILPGDEGKTLPRYEFVRADENGKVVWRKTTYTPFWFSFKILDNFSAQSFTEYIKRQRNQHASWVTCYPALFHTRVVNWNDPPHSWGKTFGRYYLEWITRFMARGWIPFCFTDDALLNTPGLTEEKIREFFAKPYPDLSTPPGYKEFVASGGVEGR